MSWYLRFGSCVLVPVFWFLVPVFWFLCSGSYVPVPVFWFPCSGSCVLVPVFRFLCSGSCVLVPVFWFLCSGSCVPVPMFRFLCSGSCVLVPVFRFLCSGSCVLVPVFWFLFSGSCVLVPVFWFSKFWFLCSGSVSSGSCVLQASSPAVRTWRTPSVSSSVAFLLTTSAPRFSSPPASVRPASSPSRSQVTPEQQTFIIDPPPSPTPRILDSGLNRLLTLNYGYHQYFILLIFYHSDLTHRLYIYYTVYIYIYISAVV